MKNFAAVVALFALTGCGAPALSTSASVAPTALSAESRHHHHKVEPRSYVAGKAAGLAHFDTELAHGKGAAKPAQRKLQAVPAAIEPYSFQLGYVEGVLTGAINSYSRITGSYDSEQWKSFAEMNSAAMQDALNGLTNNPDIRAEYGPTIGILQGGITAYNNLQGSFDSSQWMSFAQSNKAVLEQALASVKS